MNMTHMTSKLTTQVLAGLLALAGLALNSPAVDFHVTTAQELQNALTLAAANGADDTIYLAAGYYTGNFNFNSSENRSLVLQGAPGTTNTQITIDPAGTGRGINLANTGTGNFTVKGMTFLRNCANADLAALRITGGTVSTLLVDSCRFLMPSNPAALGIGLEVSSGQNATLTNCMFFGKVSGSGRGAYIKGVSGNVAVGVCTFATNSPSLEIEPAGSASLMANRFLNNLTPASVKAYGNLSFINNTAVGNLSSPTFGSPALGLTGFPIIATGNIFQNNEGGGLKMNPADNQGASLVLSNNIFANNQGTGCSLDSAWGPATILIANNTFTGNNHYSGSYGTVGGVGVGGHQVSSCLIIGNVFAGNSASGYGPNIGGLHCSVPATITNNFFTGNSASSGLYWSCGGLCCSVASVVADNTFTGNTAVGGIGGAIAFAGFTSGTAVLSRNVIRQNSAGQGGGVYAQGPNVTITDNLIAKNNQIGSGQAGGVYVSPSSKLTMINNTVTDNTSAGNGGGLAVSISGTSEVLDVYNNIIWGNSAAGNGADVWLAGTGSKKTFRYNDVHGMYGVWDIADNLLDVAPVFFDPVNGDYHLRNTSPCINAGTNGAPSIPAVDLDGNARTNAAIVDLGCYEFNNTACHPADVNQNWAIDATEYANYAAAWKNNQSWPTGPANIPADFVTRAGYLQNQGGTYHNDGAGAPLCWKPGVN